MNRYSAIYRTGEATAMAADMPWNSTENLLITGLLCTVKRTAALTMAISRRNGSEMKS